MSGNINFNGWINDDGSENYKCRAWVNFNSVGTVSIRGSGGVSSITDYGAGQFGVNLSFTMPDINYSAVAGGSQSTSNNNGAVMGVFMTTTGAYSVPTTTSFRVINYHAANSALGDSDYNNVAVFR